MTDLEMTRLCAEAMGYKCGHAKYQPHYQCWCTNEDSAYDFQYDPLHKDAQAMALVKFLKPCAISYNIFAGKWSVHTPRDLAMGTRWEGWDTDLNRAIVECVAKMQREKQK